MFLFCEGSGKDLQQGIEAMEDRLPSTGLFSHDTPMDESLHESEEFELVR